MNFKNIKDLKKEIEEEEKIFETLDTGAQKRIRRDFDRVTKTERLFIIENLKAKLQTLQEVCEEIGKGCGEFIEQICEHEEYCDVHCGEGSLCKRCEELLKKFQGDEK